MHELVERLVYLNIGEHVTINFEYADDVHIELSHQDWQKFCLSIPDKDVKRYFEHNFSDERYSFQFEKDLKLLGIKFEKFAYYDIDI